MHELLSKNLLTNICYTERVYDRVNKKLTTNYSKVEIEALVSSILTEIHPSQIQRIGKNLYISNAVRNVRLTINVHTSRLITVDMIDKSLGMI